MLPRLLREHGEALESDFQHYYQIDLLDVYRGDLSVRKTTVLALNLPAGAAVWQDMGIDAAWTTQDHLTALIADSLQLANWQRGGGKGKQPKPIPRPEDAKKKEDAKQATLDKARRFKEKQKLNIESE